VTHLEKHATAALGFNLYTTRREWQNWLTKLREYHSSLVYGQPTNSELEMAYVLVTQAIEDNIAALPIEDVGRSSADTYRADEPGQKSGYRLASKFGGDYQQHAQLPPVCYRTPPSSTLAS
jgi:hypothetical protein